MRTGRHPLLRGASLLLLAGAVALSARGRDRGEGGVADFLGLEAGRPTAAVVFQALDCADARSALARWNGEVEGVDVVGVLVGPRPGEAGAVDDLLRASGITFEVVRKPPRGLELRLRGLGYRATPLVLGFDAAGRLRAARPISTFRDRASVATFLRRLTAETRS